MVFDPYNLFVFNKCLTTQALEKFQYGYHGKNGKVRFQIKQNVIIRNTTLQGPPSPTDIIVFAN